MYRYSDIYPGLALVVMSNGFYRWMTISLDRHPHHVEFTELPPPDWASMDISPDKPVQKRTITFMANTYTFGDRHYLTYEEYGVNRDEVIKMLEEHTSPRYRELGYHQGAQKMRSELDWYRNRTGNLMAENKTLKRRIKRSWRDRRSRRHPFRRIARGRIGL